MFVLLIVVSGCLGNSPPTSEGCGGAGAFEGGENARATFYVDGGRVNVTVEVADSVEERRRGLMFRESLPRNHGMVFVYGGEDVRTFWMKNTYIPLDMVFVDREGRVVNIEHAVPQPNASDAELRRYSSGVPVKYVFEFGRGFANRSGVGRGSCVELHPG